MQEELTALQPELIQTSAETDKLMEKIEQDSVEVEAQKEVRWDMKTLYYTNTFHIFNQSFTCNKPYDNI